MNIIAAYSLWIVITALFSWSVDKTPAQTRLTFVFGFIVTTIIFGALGVFSI